MIVPRLMTTCLWAYICNQQLLLLLQNKAWIQPQSSPSWVQQPPPTHTHPLCWESWVSHTVLDIWEFPVTLILMRWLTATTQFFEKCVPVSALWCTGLIPAFGATQSIQAVRGWGWGVGVQWLYWHIEAETKWPPFCRQHFQIHKNVCITLKNLFPSVQFEIGQHWFGWWLGAEQATGHCVDRWWPGLVTHILVTRPQWVNICVSFLR